MATKPVRATDRSEVAADLDRVSLAQALQDVEIANGRVMDLTQRLIEANNQLVALRRQLDDVAGHHRALQDEHAAMQGSAAFRLASRIWAIRNLLRG